MKFLSYQVIYFFISFWLGWVCRDFFQKKELNKFSRSEKNVDSSRVSSKSVISKSVSKTASYVPEIKKKVRPSKAVVNKAARKERPSKMFAAARTLPGPRSAEMRKHGGLARAAGRGKATTASAWLLT